MRAVVFNGMRDVSVEDVPDPFVEQPTDVVVKITAANIGGSDLHTYEGRTDLKPGTVMGHESLGEVVEVGHAVRKIRPGDRVCLPYNVSCGFCKNCAAGRTGCCLTVTPPSAGGAYGYPNMGPYSGGQAEYLRVPYADFNALKLPEDSVDKENDYVMLAAVFPTGWHGTQLAQLEPGDSVVVFGAGPIGIMAAYSSLIQGAAKVFAMYAFGPITYCSVSGRRGSGDASLRDAAGAAAADRLWRDAGLDRRRGCEAAPVRGDARLFAASICARLPA